MRGRPAARPAQRAFRPLQHRLVATARPALPAGCPPARLARHLMVLAATCVLVPFGLRPPSGIGAASAAPPPGWDHAADAARVAVRHYRVVKGDSLAGVAARFDLQPDTLRWANGLGDLEPLIVGQELRVPPVDGVLHYLARDETPLQAALAYGADPVAVAEYNGLADLDRPLRTAQLMVPGGRARGTEVVASLGRAAGPDADRPTADARLLRFNDVTLWVVDDRERQEAAARAAHEPAKTWAQIEAESARATAAALEASRQGVPKPVDYEVRPGDTLSVLAERFGVTQLTILAANELRNSDALQIGQVLLIPPVTGVLYTVQEDDTLYEIAMRHRVDLGPIIDYNELESASALSVGQRLLIPGAEPQRPAPATPLPPDRGRETLASADSRLRVESARLPDTARAGSGASAASAGGVKGEVLTDFAMRYLGHAYVFGGTTPAGFDCSGFVYYVHRQQGIALSRGMLGQYGAGPHVSRDNLRPGDIVFFSNTYMPGLSHNGIYVGNGKFVHASHPGVGVVVSSLSEAYWASRYSGATRAH